MSRMFQHPGELPPSTISAPVRSGASVVAIVCAIGSFWTSAHHHQLFGLLLALIAIGAGLLGGLRALSPRVTGGILSIMAVVLGVIAILFSVLAIVF